MPGSTAHCTTFKGPGEKKKEKGKGDAKKNQGLLIFFSSLWVNFQHVVAVVYSFFSSFFFLRACVCREALRMRGVGNFGELIFRNRYRIQHLKRERGNSRKIDKD